MKKENSSSPEAAPSGGKEDLGAAAAAAESKEDRMHRRRICIIDEEARRRIPVADQERAPGSGMRRRAPKTGSTLSEGYAALLPCLSTPNYHITTTTTTTTTTTPGGPTDLETEVELLAARNSTLAALTSYKISLGDMFERRPFLSTISYYPPDAKEQGEEGKGEEVRYVGLAPERARAGDVVVVLEGVIAPLVLRREDYCEEEERGKGKGKGKEGKERWRLVGVAYVHGIMDGEAFGDEVEREVFYVY